MIEHPYQQLRSRTPRPSRQLSVASTVISSKWRSAIQNRNSSADECSIPHYNLTHPPASQHNRATARAHWSDSYINPPYHPSTRQYPLDNCCRTSSSAEAIDLHSGLQKQGYSADQGTAYTIDHHCASAPCVSAIGASCSQEQLSSAKPLPLDFPSSPKANHSDWASRKRARTAPGTRQLRYHAEEEGSYTGRSRTGNPPSYTFRPKRQLRSWSLGRAGTPYCTTTYPLEDVVIPPPLHPLALREDPLIHNTDPQKTASTWKAVRKMSFRLGTGSSDPSYAQQTVSSSSKHRLGYTTRSVSSTKSNSKKKAPSPYDSGFDRRVLTPRNITLSEMETSMVQANLLFKQRSLMAFEETTTYKRGRS